MLIGKLILTSEVYMVTRPRPLSKAGFRVTIDSYSGFFTEFSGLELERDNEKVAMGNSRYKVPIHGLIEIADVELGKPVEAGDASLARLVERSTREPLTIVVQAVEDSINETPIGQPITLLGCVVVGFKGYETERDSADASMIELTITVADYKVG